MTRLKTARFIRIFALLAGFSELSQAQKGKWQYLGEAYVDGAVDHDNIVVTSARGSYRAIQIKVEKAPIEFDRVVVHFANGGSDPIQIRSRIPAGAQTRVIDLPGDRRVIQRVEFWYGRASGSSKRPKVRLFALH